MKLTLSIDGLSIALSLPSRERGLKFSYPICNTYTRTVAPFAGAWIEISYYLILLSYITVAPFAGAWIEIQTRELYDWKAIVAPFAGAWIEIPAVTCTSDASTSLPSRERGLKSGHTADLRLTQCRSLRGSVD